MIINEYRCSINMLNKSENATPELFAIYIIYKIMQASIKQTKVYLNIQKNWLCIAVKVLRMLSRGNTQKSFICDRVPIFQVANLNRNLTRFTPSEIHYQPDSTA